ncbi:MAG: autotransporter-associated beta strand repeat-containing protein [Thermoguttaceae bacterium]
MSAYAENVGYMSPGTFIQSGGTNNVGAFLYLGQMSAISGVYNLSGSGYLSANYYEYVGYNGPGTVNQSGGTNNAGTFLYLAYSSFGSGTYNLSGSAQLSASNEYVGYSAGEPETGGVATFNQTGGTNTVSMLLIGNSGSYSLAGGVLQVNGSLVNKGTFSGGATPATLNGSGIIDLSNGVNLGALSVTIGTNSLLIVPAGFNTATGFASFSTLGMTHTAGTTLTVPAGQGFAGWGAINDPVVCQGTISTPSGGSLNLNNGLSLSGTGVVNLGYGSLTTNDLISGISGGSLSAGMQCVGQGGTGIFTQTGGTNSINSYLYLGYNAGDSGTYNLSSSGQISIRNQGVIGLSGTGTFTQFGGTSSISALNLGYYPGGSGTYNLSGTGQLTVGDENVGYYGLGSITQSGGSCSVSSLNIGYGGIGIYNLSGNGRLSGYNETLGNFAGLGTFMQSGGTNTANYLLMSPNFYTSGAYLLSGGMVSATREILGEMGPGTFTQSGGTNIAQQYFALSGMYSSSSGTYNLDAGQLIVPSLGQGAGSATFNFNGGTLQAGSAFSTSVAITLGTSGGGATFDTAGFSVTLAGALSGPGSLTKVNSGTLILAASNAYTGSTTISAGTLQVGTGGSGSSIGSTGGILDNGSLVFNHADAISLSPIISGSGDVMQAGAGILTLLASNTYTGGTTISAGTLQVGDGGSGASIGSTSSLLNNGSLVFNHGDAVIFAPRISGSGNLTQTGTGILTLTGNNTYTGGTTITAGTLVFASSQAIGGSGANVTANYGAAAAAGYPMDQNFLNRLVLSSSGVAALTTNSSNALSFSGFPNLRLGAVGTVNYSGILTPSGTTYRLGGGGGILTVSGPFSGANSLDVDTNGTPAGTVILVGADTYTGPTQVSGGTLVVQGSNASSAFTAHNGGTLQFSGANIDLGSAYVRALSGELVQYQNVNITGGFLRGPGTHVLAPGSANTFNATTINTGAVVQQMGSAALLDVTNRGQIVNSAPLTWDGGLNDGGATLTVTNTATVSEWNNAGVIVISSSGVLNNHETDLTSYGGGRITVNSGGTLNADSQSEGVALDLQDSLLVNNGTVTGTTNVYYGATVKGTGSFGPINLFDGGTLAISPSASPLASGLVVSGGSITGAGQSALSATIHDATLVAPNPTDLLVLSGNLSGDGSLAKLGAGTVVLSGSNSYVGATTISDGTLILASNTALADGTSLMVDAGGTFIFDPAQAASSVAGSAGTVAVPEPSTLVLLGVGVLAVIVYRWRRNRRVP